MQLSLLGKPYEASVTAVDAVSTAETGTFLGQSYDLKQYTIAQRQQPAAALTYRGQRYTR